MEVEVDGSEAACESSVEPLELASVIGFEGTVVGGLICHPDGEHLIYSFGCKVILKNLNTNEQTFLHGHSSNVSCLNCSTSGHFLASGQITHMGFKADIIVWDFAGKSLYARFSLHKVRVQAVAFSPNDKYLASLGGQDDNSLVIWDLETREPVCGCPAAMTSAGMVHALSFSSTRDDIILSGGDGTLRVWELNPKIRKVLPTDCNLGQLKRVIKCIKVSDEDEFMYCGTTSGDVLQVSIMTTLIRHFGPQKKKYSQGVAMIHILSSGHYLVGTGDGLLAETNGPPNFKMLRSIKFPVGITSIASQGDGGQLFVGCGNSQMYRLDYETFDFSLLASCHGNAIYNIVFPRDSSDLFATSSKHDVRVWHAQSGKELLRVTMANLACNAVDITPDGKAIITAWDDGKIRAFYPETGKHMYTIHNAHNKGVTAIACTSSNRRLVSGGGEGQVRVWDVTKQGITSMKEAMKEHKGKITCVKITASDKECVTSSTDGTCIIWDLVTFIRSQIIFANTMFCAVCYHPDECQIITVGTDRKISYWEIYDGSQIRELDGSKTDSINGMDVYGDNFVTGGGDNLIKVWRYNAGEITHVGAGHSGEVTGVKISPDGRFIVSVSNDGAIMRWKFPDTNQQATPTVPTLNLPVDSMSPRQDTTNPQQEVAIPEQEPAASPQPETVCPKQEEDVGGASSRQDQEMEVGGATPKQEE